jgi:hypothetical protein
MVSRNVCESSMLLQAWQCAVCFTGGFVSAHLCDSERDAVCHRNGCQKDSVAQLRDKIK